MRVWLKDSERKPDPAPAKTDDRKAVLVGLALWVVGLIVLVLAFASIDAAGREWWLWTCVAGIVIGLAGLVYTSVKRSRQ